MEALYTIRMSLHHLRLWLFGDERLKDKDLWEVWCRDWRPYRHKRQQYHKLKQFRWLAYTRLLREMRAYNAKQ